MAPVLLTTEEVAARTQLHPVTLRRLIREGRGPTPTRIAGHLRFKPDLVEAWIDRSTTFQREAA